MQLPAGYQRFEVEGAVLVLHGEHSQPLLAAGVHDPAGLIARATGGPQGRTRLARVALGDSGTALVRCLHRGGLLGKLVRRLSFDPHRALAELLVSTGAAARGAHVLEVLGAVSRPERLGWVHGLITREVDGARDLQRVLRTTPPGADRTRALIAAGRAVARLHAAGVDHVDLNLKNVLLPRARDGGDGDHALVIDLDRCRIASGPASPAVVEGNLLRLLRSWHKLAAAEPAAVRPRDPLHFLRGYAPGPEARARRRHLTALGRARRFFWRRLLWAVRPPRLEPLAAGA